MKLGSVLGKVIHAVPEKSDELILDFAKIGVEVELENWDGGNPTDWWDNHRDDSLRNNGQEFTTRGGLQGKHLVQAIDELCAAAIARNWSTGHPRAAIHVHIDCTDMDMEQGHLATFMSFYMLVEHAMFGFAGEWRRGCGFCEAYSDSNHDFNVLGRALYDSTGKALVQLTKMELISKYQAVNLNSLNKFGTLEFRQLPTTFDRERILAWINCIMQLKAAAMKYDIKKPLLAQFSIEGAVGFVRGIMGPMWETLEPFFREHRAWNAIDNAMALQSYGRIIIPEDVASPKDAWAEDYDKPSPPVLAKIEKIKQRKKPVGKADAYAEYADEVAAAAPMLEPADEIERLRRQMGLPVRLRPRGAGAVPGPFPVFIPQAANQEENF